MPTSEAAADLGPVVAVGDRIAAHGLDFAHDRFPVCATDQWPGVYRYIVGQRLTGLAVAACDAGELLIEEHERRELDDAQRTAMIQALEIESSSRAIVDALAGAGIRAVMLKGAALAHTVYPDAAWRPFGDLDLLVSTGEWYDALDVLAERGWARKTPEPRPGFDVRFGKGATLVGPVGVDVDLHRTLAPGPYGLTLDLDELLGATSWFRVGGVFRECLDDDAAFIHACMHAVLAPPPSRAIPIRDIAQLIERGHLDWDRIADRARRWKVEVVVHDALEIVVRRLGLPLEHDAKTLATMPVPGRERRRIDAYRSPRRFKGGTAVALLAAVTGVRAKSAYLLALALPTSSFARGRHGGGRGSYLRRWAVPLRWLLSGTRRAARRSTSPASRDLLRGPDVAA